MEAANAQYSHLANGRKIMCIARSTSDVPCMLVAIFREINRISSTTFITP